MTFPVCSRTSLVLPPALIALALALPFVPSPGRSAGPPVLAEAVLPEEPQSYEPQSAVLQAGGDGEIWSVALSPDGKTLAVGSGGPRQRPNATGALILWDFTTGKEIATLNTEKAVRWVAFSPDGKTLATGEFDTTAKLRDPATGAVRHVLRGHSIGVGPVLFTPDSKKVLTGGIDNVVKVWDVASGKLLSTLEGHKGSVLGMVLARDGNTLYTVSREGTGKMWDVKAAKELKSMQFSPTGGECITLSPDEKTLLTGHPDGTIKLHDAKTLATKSTVLAHQRPVTMALFSPDGRTIASTSQDSEVRLMDVATGATRFLSGHTTVVYGLAWTKDGASVISGGWDKVVKVWDAKLDKELRTLALRQFGADVAFPLTGISCSPDGKLLALCGEEKVIKLVEAGSGKILRMLDGHEDFVARVRFSPDGKTLASASFDSTIKLWDVETGKERHTLKGHTNWVFSVAFSPDGRTLVSGGFDRTVRLWDAIKGEALGVLGKHKGGVRAVAFSRDGKKVASGGADKALKVWDVAKREATHTLKGHDDAIRALCFSPDGALVVSGGEDNTVRLWNLAQEKQIGLHRCNEVVRDVAFSPRGVSLVAVCQDATMHMLDPTTLAIRPPGNMFTGHSDAVTAVAFASNGQTLYTASADQMVRVWAGSLPPVTPRLTYSHHQGQTWVALPANDGKLLITGGADRLVQVRKMESAVVPLAGPLGLVQGVACSRDGARLATAHSDQTIRLWNRKTGRRNGMWRLTQPGWCVAFSPNGDLLASGSGNWQDKTQPGQVRIYDLAAKTEKLLEGHKSIVSELCFSPDDKTLASCGWDGTVKLWDVASGKERATLGFAKGVVVSSLAFRSDGKMLAAVAFDGTIKLWNPETAKEIATMQAEKSVLQGVSFSPDGMTLAVGINPAGDPEKPVWGSPGVGAIALWDVATRKEMMRTKGHTGKVLGVAFSPDGKVLASGGGRQGMFPGEVKLWDARTGKPLGVLHGARQWVRQLAFSPDGRVLIAIGGADGTRESVAQWDMDVERSRIVLRGHSGNINCAALTRDGKVLATGGADNTIRLWDTSTWKSKGVLTGHTGRIFCLDFSPDGKTVVSASDDFTARLWDVDKGKEKKTLGKFAIGVKAVAWSPDGTLIAAGSSSEGAPTGEVRVFEAATGKERRGGWKLRAGLTLAFSPDGRWLATGAPGFPSLFVFDVKSGKQVQTVQTASTRCLAFSPDSRMLATGHGTGGRRGNGSIILWDTTTWRERSVLQGHTALCLRVAFSRDGRTLTSSSTDGTARVWNVPPATKGLRARR